MDLTDDVFDGELPSFPSRSSSCSSGYSSLRRNRRKTPVLFEKEDTGLETDTESLSGAQITTENKNKLKKRRSSSGGSGQKNLSAENSGRKSFKMEKENRKSFKMEKENLNISHPNVTVRKNRKKPNNTLKARNSSTACEKVCPNATPRSRHVGMSRTRSSGIDQVGISHDRSSGGPPSPWTPSYYRQSMPSTPNAGVPNTPTRQFLNVFDCTF